MQISKRLGEAWHALDDASKAPFYEKASAAKEQYDAAMKEWRAKQPPKIKKPSTAYNFFMKEQRATILASNPSLTQSQAMAEVGKAWKAADEATKAKFKEMALADKHRYKRQLAATAQVFKFVRCMYYMWRVTAALWLAIWCFTFFPIEVRIVTTMVIAFLQFIHMYSKRMRLYRIEVALIGKWSWKYIPFMMLNAVLNALIVYFCVC